MSAKYLKVVTGLLAGLLGTLLLGGTAAADGNTDAELLGVWSASTHGLVLELVRRDGDILHGFVVSSRAGDNERSWIASGTLRDGVVQLGLYRLRSNAQPPEGKLEQIGRLDMLAQPCVSEAGIVLDQAARSQSTNGQAAGTGSVDRGSPVDPGGGPIGSHGQGAGTGKPDDGAPATPDEPIGSHGQGAGTGSEDPGVAEGEPNESYAETFTLIKTGDGACQP